MLLLLQTYAIRGIFRLRHTVTKISLAIHCMSKRQARYLHATTDPTLNVMAMSMYNLQPTNQLIPTSHRPNKHVQSINSRKPVQCSLPEGPASARPTRPREGRPVLRDRIRESPAQSTEKNQSQQNTQLPLDATRRSHIAHRSRKHSATVRNEAARKCQPESRCSPGKSTCSPRNRKCRWSCHPSICIVSYGCCRSGPKEGGRRNVGPEGMSGCSWR